MATPDDHDVPPVQDDTDRIIAANREEAAKTRRLLLWIFVGIPAVGLCLWLVIAVGNGHSITSTNSECGSTSTTTYIDLSACPLSGPQLDDDSLCSAYTADDNQTTPDNETNPAVYFDNQHTLGDLVKFGQDCSLGPEDTLGMVLQQEGLPQ